MGVVLAVDRRRREVGLAWMGGRLNPTGQNVIVTTDGDWRGVTFPTHLCSLNFNGLLQPAATRGLRAFFGIVITRDRLNSVSLRLEAAFATQRFLA